ncbi:OsmC family peroxiredoxin [Demequina activiva]|uniref:Peroxiredoxin n=1 Tax=Demequina activiva TaxID=1582364 RepID=A0A919Q672_9MICO|nr:OsmC family peroxiredoxin [Demequina activiva]GIG54560.1 peroxiredoxin [Demequina activiva]
MAVKSTASTLWKGSLGDGSGTTSFGTGIATLSVDWKARSEGSSTTTTPEELLAAAHASCYAMALSNELGQAGHAPEELQVSAEVSFQAGEGITGIVLKVEATVPGIDEDEFLRIATGAKDGCPVSKALAGTTIELGSATLG